MTPTEYEFEVFYDGDCPLCVREIRFMQWCDKRRHKILFTDIAHPSFDPTVLGKTMDELMGEIHGRMPNGDWVIGVEVFQRLYAAIGLGFLVWPTKLPGLDRATRWAYSVFARNRLRWTGRCQDGCRVTEARVNEKREQASAAVGDASRESMSVAD